MNFIKKNYSSPLILLVFLLALFFRLNKISTQMAFIGDQGWFYLSARDLVLGLNFPLVGITSSHTWIHQGPFWTYILAFLFWVTRFNPLVPGYFTALLDAGMVVVVYFVSLKLYSRRIGIISSLLYASSPALILSSRMPYHTSPIPLFTVLFFFFISRVANGKQKFVPLSVLCLSILYNFELATQVLWITFFLVFIINFKKLESIKRKMIIKTLFSFILPLLPVIIYDFGHGFNQTIKFVIWTIASPIKSLIFGSSSGHTYFDFAIFFYNFLKELIFYPSGLLSILILFCSVTVIVYSLKKEKKKYQTADFVLLISTLIPLVVFMFNKTPSGAYLPIFFPLIVILEGRFFSSLRPFVVPVLVVLIISILNINSLFSLNYFTKSKHNLFIDRLTTSKRIVSVVGNRSYVLIGKGEGSQFRSFTMNYEYLTWYLGHPMGDKTSKLKLVIEEKNNRIYLEQK